ncbi:hypothetical protein [Brevibacterium linens]|uniref:hypothetical protein n=1 Tax=Brevibacterium linens TaxID=1703 RepID=UPI0013E0B698|nr:hypothetical protein [Brevibacterium linens]
MNTRLFTTRLSLWRRKPRSQLNRQQFHVAFVADVFNREIVGWQVSRSLQTELALDALQMGIYQRKRAGGDLFGLVHHWDRPVSRNPIWRGPSVLRRKFV